MAFVLSVSVVVSLYISIAATAWTYEQLDLWPELCQTGKKQSPVALSKKTATRTAFSALQLANYNKNFRVRIENNGHTVEMKILNEEDKPIISGGYLKGKYILDNIHFHWKSEHTIDGRSVLACDNAIFRYPLEGHYVHYSKDYGMLSDAIGKTNGIVVLAVMFEEDQSNSKHLEDLVNATKVIGKTVHVPTEIGTGFMLDDIILKKKTNFYHYKGSLTTPDCKEEVTWIVFDNPLKISKEQLKQFYEVVTETGEPLAKNYRPLQKLNGRNVCYV